MHISTAQIILSYVFSFLDISMNSPDVHKPEFWLSYRSCQPKTLLQATLKNKADGLQLLVSSGRKARDCFHIRNIHAVLMDLPIPWTVVFAFSIRSHILLRLMMLQIKWIPRLSNYLTHRHWNAIGIGFISWTLWLSPSSPASVQEYDECHVSR